MIGFFLWITVLTLISQDSFENNFMHDPLIKRIPYEKDRMIVLMKKIHPLAGEKSRITVPVSPETGSQISLCYRADKTLSTVAQQFVEFCTHQSM